MLERASILKLAQIWAILLWFPFLVFVGSLTASSSLPEPIAQEYASSQQNASQESIADISAEIVAHYTKMLAWFTGILAVASLVQGVFLYRADQTARISADAAKTAAERQIALTQSQTDILERQKEISERQINLSEEMGEKEEKIERAYVFVNVQEDQARGTVLIKLLNTGKTPAILRQTSAYLVLEETIPQALRAYLSEEEMTRELPPIAGGDNYAFGLKMPNHWWVDVQNAAKTVYAVGELQYEDIFGKTRKTGFCWRYNWNNVRGWYSMAPNTPLNFYT